jgi:hypothetical protein
MQLFVRTLRGPTCVIDATAEDTVGLIKLRLEASTRALTRPGQRETRARAMAAPRH